MANARDLPEAIQWHEGMLLGPQHFQQDSLRQEELLHYHLQAAAPFHWGIQLLEIDPDLLVEGQFRISALAAVMPDGLVIASARQEARDLTLDLAPYKNMAADHGLVIHLAVPAKRGSGSPGRGELARYESIEGRPIPDANTGEGELRIPRLRPRVSLIPGDTPAEKFVSFPVARVVYRDPAFALDNYVPPLLRVRRQSPLGELCLKVAGRVREKAMVEAEKAKSPSVAARAPQLLESKGKIRSLAVGLPPFEALLQTDVTHPFPLYLSLCSLVGHLSSLGASLVPPILEAYDHNDLFATFSQAKLFIDRVIAEGFIESYDVYSFSQAEAVFSLAYDARWQRQKNFIGVRAGSGRTEADSAAWIDDALIGSESRMPSMRQRRILGAQRGLSPGEGDLVPTPGVTLYELTPDPEYIVPDEALMIMNPDDSGGRHRPAEIVL